MRRSRRVATGLTALLLASAALVGGPGAATPCAAQPDQPAAAPAPGENADPSRILVEIFLAPDRKGDLDAIKERFRAVGIVKVRAKLFQLGHPPRNVAIGREIPAPIARLAIELARAYNDGIIRLLPEQRLAPAYLAIGTSIFDELFQIPVSPEDVDRLADPSLSTERFHELYRQLTAKPLAR